jgi:hypothetical protein
MAEEFKGHEELLDEVIGIHKGNQLRFTVTEFRDVLYLGIRQYYEDFDGEWQPTPNGVTLPYTIDVTARLYHSLKSLLSTAETLEEVQNESNRLDEGS